MIGGGLHVEGELSCHHITAPTEIQVTEQVALQGAVITGEPYLARIVLPTPCPVGCVLPVQESAVITFKWHPRVQMNEHSHQFRNIPLTLTQSHDDVREVGKANNMAEKIPSSIPRDNDHEQGTSGKGEKI